MARGITTFVIAFALIPLVSIAAEGGLPAEASAQAGFLTQNLTLGSEGEQVSLLQSWLAEDPAVYPEGEVSGVYGPLTEAAVRRYQKKIGVISEAGEYGSLGLMTRAALNAEFSPEQGGVSWVPLGYGDAMRWDGSSFIAPAKKEYKVSKEIRATVSAWVYPATLPGRTAVLFEENGGYGIGFEGGKIYARDPEGAEVITANDYIIPLVWQHISIIFTDENAIFLYNDVPVEAGELIAPKRSLWGRIVSFFAPPQRQNRVDPSTSISSAPAPAQRGIFGWIPDFFNRFVETSGRVGYVSSIPEVSVPEQRTETSLSIKTPESSTLPSFSQGGQSGSNVRRTASPIDEHGKPKSGDDVDAETTEISDIVATTTATTTPSLVDGFAPVATSTAETTVASTTAEALVAEATTTPALDPVRIPSYGGGGGGGGRRGDGNDVVSQEPNIALETATSTESSITATTTPAAPEPANQKPTLALVGAAETHLPVGSSYTESGATAADPEDGDISSSVAVGGDTVNNYLAGTYTVTYAVADSKGLAADALSRTVVIDPPSALPDSAQEPSYTLAPLGEPASLSISSSKDADPKFAHADITPLHVYVGQTQTLSVTVTSAQPITSVTATTNLDTQTLTLNLKETGVDSVSGGKIFSTSWTVFDTHVTTYRTTFTATNEAGQSNSITLAWSDPCAGITQGADSTISSACIVASVNGLDGGNLTIPVGVTLTLNSGALWAWNSGKSITVTGAIALNGTATMQKGNLWYSGTTNATANASTKIFDAASTKTGHMRVNTWFGFTGAFTDQFNVAQNATITSNTITVGDIVASPTVTISGASGTMSINGDAFSATSRTISNGQTIQVRLTSSNQGGVLKSVTVTLSGTGGDTATFNVETGCTPNLCL